MEQKGKILDFIHFLLLLCNSEDLDHQTVFHLQAFTSASQGFLNCLVYGWTRLLRHGPALSQRVHAQTPLLHAKKHRSSYQSLCGAAG